MSGALLAFLLAFAALLVAIRTERPLQARWENPDKIDHEHPRNWVVARCDGWYWPKNDSSHLRTDVTFEGRRVIMGLWKVTGEPLRRKLELAGWEEIDPVAGDTVTIPAAEALGTILVVDAEDMSDEDILEQAARFWCRTISEVSRAAKVPTVPLHGAGRRPRRS
ncbi:MAG: hypothetical protein A3J48_01905 [Candidatus Doudnabacteria bacterium RIFCSPHIGHO2_02_FULL_46_11]|uniref:Uncharacterized protein n=1 Tax=Candidatus Doudnabacteria bacterium RIFCSPHIGHO2_02_FULL_46_11 TaxID=1817832 RepID=A0A1F5PA93_9BACT|nr:MAG: hypothetical protein A3J48_01905 [Candidatus Doudnabacteria bacterium RIFCSPHIGHO2_02_FULL_46_11]